MQVQLYRLTRKDEVCFIAKVAGWKTGIPEEQYPGQIV